MVSRSSIPEPVTSGLELRRRRKYLRINQSTLASITGIHYQTLSKMERGKSRIQLPHARHFGLLFAWIELHSIAAERAAREHEANTVAVFAPASAPVPTRTLAPGPVPTLARLPAYKWLDDAWSKDITDPVMQVMTDHLYWESDLRPDGSLGPWRQKVRARTSNCRTDVFTNEPERIPD